ERDEVGTGSVAVLCPPDLVASLAAAFASSRVEYGHASRHGLSSQLTVVPVGLVKGLELDASVVVEPQAILDQEAQGARALYVALTRATKRVAIVHSGQLPEVLATAAH